MLNFDITASQSIFIYNIFGKNIDKVKGKSNVNTLFSVSSFNIPLNDDYFIDKKNFGRLSFVHDCL